MVPKNIGFIYRGYIGDIVSYLEILLPNNIGFIYRGYIEDIVFYLGILWYPILPQ